MRRFQEDAWLYTIIGAQKPINFFWASFTLLGSLVMLFSAASYYYGKIFLSFDSSRFAVSSLPQGVTLTFYGIAGLFVSFHWWMLIFLNVGSGYNLYDRKIGMVWLFRYGFPGENRCILSHVRVEDILGLLFDVRTGVLYMYTREQGAIPLTPDDADRTPRESVLKTAYNLAAFLDVPLQIK
uniref:photosystem I assembly protein Ycf4 n=1 Tax=Chesneya acaulis TaxID=1844621 RepID=UPI0020284591|nr:photosystem I assembly protein Ycf4 [Chesneya acaulis]UPT34380.1 photosystem I assembly protein Ycf4 [Chesneya acaulis]